MTTSHAQPPAASTAADKDGIATRVLGFLRSRGDRIFLRHVDAQMKVEELSFRDFFLHAMITSSLYDRYEVPIGGTVILVLSNPKDVFLAVAGALLTGRVPIVSAHPSTKLSLGDFGRTLLPLIDNAAPALIVGDPAYCSYLSAAIGRRVASFDDIVAPKILPPVGNADIPTLFIQYSSGTTGTKKGVAISRRQLLWQVDAYAREIGLTEGDHIVSWLPYYHDMGLLTSLMTPLLTGTPITVMSPFDWVKNPLMLMKVISRDRGTLTWLPNFAYNFMAQAAQRGDLKDLDLSVLRGVINCSEPVSAASHAVFLAAFKPYGLAESALAASYAMAETTFAITSGGFGRPLKADHIDRSRLASGAEVVPGNHTVVSSGRAVAGTELRIFSNERATLGERCVGEIGVRSPSLMNGYFGNPEATAKVFHDGYFLTGDLGYIDSGEVFVTGRIKDLIITAGRNIYPQDIEAVVEDLPHVIKGRCVAFGISDDKRGTESVVVIAERETGAAADARQIGADISRAVTARFDVALADVLVVDAGWLKKSTSGKIARGQNRDRYLAQKSAAPTHRVDAASPEDVVRGCVQEVTGVWVEDPAAPLVTSGLVDSLALTNLLLALESAFKKSLPSPETAGYDAYDSIAAITKIVASEYKPSAVPFVLVIDRQVKANCVLEGPRDFDTLILGSSRAYLIRAGQAAKHGLHAFQFSAAGVRMEEIYCIAAFFRQTNRAPLKHIILGTDPIQFAPHLPVDVRLEKSPSLFGYLEDIDRLYQGGLIRDDIGLETRSERAKSLMQRRYSAWDVDLSFDPKSGDLIKLFGHYVAGMKPLHYDTGEAEKKWGQQFLTANNLTHLHPRRLHYFAKLLEVARDVGAKVTLYTNPLHPLMIKQLGERTPYLRVQDQLVSHIRAIADASVTIFPFLTPSDYGGDDADYYDGVHMGRHNGDRLLDYILTNAS